MPECYTDSGHCDICVGWVAHSERTDGAIWAAPAKHLGGKVCFLTTSILLCCMQWDMSQLRADPRLRGKLGPEPELVRF